MAIRTQTSKIKIGEDLEATLLYNPVVDYAKQYHKATLLYVNCTITSSRFNDSEKIPDSDAIIKDTFSYTADECEDYDFNGSVYLTTIEKLNIPAEWFSCEKGSIVYTITMEICVKELSEPVYETVGKELYYIKEGDYILLFGNHYSYSNYKRRL